MRRFEGFGWGGVVTAALVAATVWACRPGEAAPPGLAARQAARHLEVCPRCRELGVAAGDVAATESPTPCHADLYPSKDARAILEDVR